MLGTKEGGVVSQNFGRVVTFKLETLPSLISVFLQTMLSFALQRRLQDSSITVSSLQPGYVSYLGGREGGSLLHADL